MEAAHHSETSKMNIIWTTGMKPKNLYIKVMNISTQDLRFSQHYCSCWTLRSSEMWQSVTGLLLLGILKENTAFILWGWEVPGERTQIEIKYEYTDLCATFLVSCVSRLVTSPKDGSSLLPKSSTLVQYYCDGGNNSCKCCWCTTMSKTYKNNNIFVP